MWSFGTPIFRSHWTEATASAAAPVSLGTVAWPVLRRAGYPSENAGGMLAAAGIGAILSPPTLGAAAFIIAEYLGVPYLTVLVWAIVPTILYYLGILLAVEIVYRPPLWLHAAIWLPLTVILALILLPPIKGALVGLQWALLMHGFDPEYKDELEAWGETEPTPRS